MKFKNLFLIVALISAMMFVGCADKANNTEVANNEVTETEETIETEEMGLTEETIKTYMTDSSVILVDTRQNDAFNGWDLDGKAGHLEGAVDFSAQWLGADEKLLDEALSNKGISADKKVVLYDTNTDQANKVMDFLTKKGFEDVAVYDLNTWTGDLVQYKNFKLVVPAQIVQEVIDGKKPATFEEAGQIKIVEASWGGAENSYDKGHVPTAFHINTDSIEPPTETEPVMWMLAADDVLEKFALDHGFTAEDTVIVTGQEQMAAYRVAVVLRYLGVKDVRVLNGGTTAWTNAGYELETEAHEAVAVTDFGAVIPGRPEIIETQEELKTSLNDDKFTLVDNRTWEEHVGESTGYSYHDKAGRIPGAIYGYAGFENAYSLSFFRNPDNTMRRPEEFVKLWQDNGIDITNRLAFMCGSGWRAAEILFYADVYGLEDLTLYSDGWIGWSNAGNPVETGDDSN